MLLSAVGVLFFAVGVSGLVYGLVMIDPIKIRFGSQAQFLGGIFLASALLMCVGLGIVTRRKKRRARIR
jgi:uncharacterized membrane protein